MPPTGASIWANFGSSIAQIGGSLYGSKLTNDRAEIEGTYAVKLAELKAKSNLDSAQYAAQLSTIDADRQKQLAAIDSKTKLTGYVVIGVVALLIVGVVVAVIVTRPRESPRRG